MTKPELRYIGNFDLSEFHKVGIETTRISIDEAVEQLDVAEYWYVDSETYARGFDPNPIRKEFLEMKLEQKGKLTKVDHKSADRHVEKERTKIVFNTRETKIRLLQILANDVVYIFDSFRCDIGRILSMLPDKKVGVQNGKYDFEIFIHQYGVYPKEVFDTMLGNRIIGLSQTPLFFQSNLKTVVKKWVDVDLDKEHGASDWGKELSSEMLLYAYYDVVYLPEIIRKMIVELNYESISKRKKPYFNGLQDRTTIIEMRFLRELCEIELAGIPINTFKLKSEFLITEAENKKAMKEIEKYDINPNSTDEIIDHCAIHGIHIEDATEVTIKSVIDRHDSLPHIAVARKTGTKMSDIKSYLKVAKDDRIYPGFNQIKAGTGRMSSYSPNVQKIPRSIKDMFYANIGNRTVVKCDYPAIEPRLMSIISGDENLKQAFKDGKDVYKFVASMITDKSIEDITKEERQRAKAILLGFQYGMGVNSFIAYAKDTFDVIFTPEEARDLKRKFFTAFPGIKRFHDTNGYYLNHNGRILTKTVIGRRAFVDSFTKANNYPVQGSGADVLKIAVIDYHEKCRKFNIDAPIITLVHDEIIIDASNDYLAIAGKYLKESMEFAADFLIKEFHSECELEYVED